MTACWRSRRRRRRRLQGRPRPRRGDADGRPTAARPTIFKIRKGIKFSNGQEVTAKDVVASFQRIFKVSSPTAGGFYNGIVGADKCLEDARDLHARGRRRRRRGGRHRDHQPRPRRTRSSPYKLAVPHASDPAGRLAGQGRGHRRRCPAPGRTCSRATTPTSSSMLVRNPHFKEWRDDAQPDGYPDEIDYDFGLTDEAAGHRDPERRGRLDVRPAAGRPPGRDRHQVRGPGARQRR